MHSLEHCRSLIEAGATALGTSSGPQLIQALRTPMSSASGGNSTDG